MCVLSSHLFWTSGWWTYQPESHRVSPPSFCEACLNFYREKDSTLPFPRRPWQPWSRVLCTYQLLIVPHLLGMIFYVFILFFVTKNPTSCDCNEIRTHVATTEGFEVINWTTGTTGYLQYCLKNSNTYVIIYTIIHNNIYSVIYSTVLCRVMCVTVYEWKWWASQQLTSKRSRLVWPP